MSKKTRRIIVMVLALALLLLIYMGINNMNQKKVEQEARVAAEEEESKITITSIASSDIASFSYDYNGETYSFTKNKDTWYWDQDEGVNLTQEDIETMLSSVAELKANRLIDETDENFADYGLDTPIQTIRIKDTGGISTVIQIGNANSTTDSYYLTLEGTETVYAVDTMAATAFQKTVEELIKEEEVTTEDVKLEDSTTEKVE